MASRGMPNTTQLADVYKRQPQVRQSAKVQFGDYQANGMMAVAKKLGMAPRQLAEQVLTHLDPVSYTHLDVYKRQIVIGSRSATAYFLRSSA